MKSVEVLDVELEPGNWVPGVVVAPGRAMFPRGMLSLDGLKTRPALPGVAQDLAAFRATSSMLDRLAMEAAAVLLREAPEWNAARLAILGTPLLSGMASALAERDDRRPLLLEMTRGGFGAAPTPEEAEAIPDQFMALTTASGEVLARWTRLDSDGFGMQVPLALATRPEIMAPTVQDRRQLVVLAAGHVLGELSGDPDALLRKVARLRVACEAAAAGGGGLDQAAMEAAGRRFAVLEERELVRQLGDWIVPAREFDPAGELVVNLGDMAAWADAARERQGVPDEVWRRELTAVRDGWRDEVKAIGTMADLEAALRVAGDRMRRRGQQGPHVR